MKLRRITEPSRWWYLVGIAVTALCFVGFVVYATTESYVPDVRVVVPGTHELDFSSAGDYAVFYEHKSIVDGRKYDTDEAFPPLSLTLTSTVTGEAVELAKPAGYETYETPEYAGTKVFNFAIEQPGMYVLEAGYDPGVATAPVVLAIGKERGLQSFLIVMGIGLGVLVGVVIIAVNLARRSAARRRVAPSPHEHM